MPLPERALELYGDEKRLVSVGGRTFGGRVPIDLLQAVEVQPRLIHESTGYAGPVLVVENSAAFDSFLAASAPTGLGWGTIVWGEGNKFAKTHRGLEPIARGRPVFYLGDLDPPGFRILQTVLRERQQRQLAPIHPLIQAYEWMLYSGKRRAEKIGVLTPGREELPGLSDQHQRDILTLWHGQQVVPQEALGTETLHRWPGTATAPNTV